MKYYGNILILPFLLMSSTVWTQTIIDNYKSNQSKIFFGSDFSSIWQPGHKSISLSPFMGYKFTDKWSIGVKGQFLIPLKDNIHKFKDFRLQGMIRYKLNNSFFLYGNYGLQYLDWRSSTDITNSLRNHFPQIYQKVDLGFGYRTSGKWGLEAKLNYAPLDFDKRTTLKIGISHKF